MNICFTQGALSAWWGGLRHDKSKSPSPPDVSPAGSPSSPTSSENQVPSETNSEPSEKPETGEEASNNMNKDQKSETFQIK